MTKISASNSEGYQAPIGLAADPVVFSLPDGRLSVLLHRRREAPGRGRWSLPGGFVGPEEDPTDTVKRKLTEKTGLPPVYLEQLGSYASPGRDPRGWLPSVAYVALVPAELLDPEQLSDARWYPVDGLPQLVFDHASMIEEGLARVRAKLWVAPIAAGLLPPEFTLAQARQIYERVGDLSYDPGNFSRDLRASGLVEEAGGRSEQGRAGRPAGLYRFVAPD